MRKIALLFIIFFSISVSGQSKYQKIWDAYLKNERKTALKFIEKKSWNKLDAEGLLLRQMLLISSGIESNQEGFHQNFVKQPDWGYYLFPVFNEPFMFDNYLSDGLNKTSVSRIKYYYEQHLQNPKNMALTLKYLQATALSFQNKEDEFEKMSKEINAVRDWEYCGVFENLNESGINIPYAPEKHAFSQTGFNANSNGIVNWYQPPLRGNDIYMYFINHAEYGSGINYAQTFVQSPKTQEVFMHLTIGRATKVWVNDVQVFEKTEDRRSQLDAYTIRFTLPKGNNRILIKTTNGSYVFFALRLTDKDGNSIPDLKFSRQYAAYNHSKAADINAKLQANEYESFFKQKIKENPQSVFYQIMLAKTYIQNSKGQLAEKVLQPLMKKYPKSTFLRLLMSDVYNIEEKSEKNKDLTKNIQNDDPDSYAALFTKMTNTKELFRKDVGEMKKFLDKVRRSTDSPITHYLADFVEYAREGNKVKLKNTLDQVIDYSAENALLNYVVLYGGVRSRMYEEQDKEIELLQKLLKKYNYGALYNRLIRIYSTKKENDKVLEMYKLLHKKDPWAIKYDKRIIDKLTDLQKYKEAQPYADQGLKKFPYSFDLMLYKGLIAQQTGRTKEAIKWYKKSLSHNSGNNKLRNRINDLQHISDPFKTYINDEMYDYIKANRGKKYDKTYDINILHDEVNLELFEEGGYRYRSVYIYEIGSEKGVELLKEYDLNLYGDYNIRKSEIVKPDGSLAPADKSRSNLVFKDLSVGDVVYIDYDVVETKTGRFYKDLTDSNTFDAIYPINNSIVRYFIPKNVPIYTKLLNGNVPFTKKRKGKYTIYEWSQKNVKAMPPEENYMPETVDVFRRINLSTIDNWNKIAQWYADLSSASIKYDNLVNETFEQIFPDGFQQLSEDQRAKKIYDYIMKNMNYSYVDFRQSGQIPQKPSKVIDTKLGDCKDLSTLFLTLGRKAGLQVNLVLVKTSDYGRNSLVLPSTAFNHAIARVVLDGKVQYLELTDKYLPYKSLPTSLMGACALDIPYQKNDKLLHNGLIHLDNVSQTKTVLQTDVTYDIYKDKHQVTIKVTGQGRVNSKLNQLLDEKNEEILKKNITDYFEGFDKLDLDLISYKIIQQGSENDKTIFEAKFNIKNKMQSLGKSKIFKLPLQLNPYTADLVNLDDRKYPIAYAFYEYIDQYKSNYTINLKDGGNFFEIPDNVNLTFANGHNFKETFQKNKNGSLQVNIDVHTPIKDISTTEYPQFKKYVMEALKAMEALIGFN